jgi:hypothetical protein
MRTKKKGTSQVIVVAFVQSSLGSKIFFDRIHFFISANFFYFRKIASIIHCSHACAIVVIPINNIYLRLIKSGECKPTFDHMLVY